VVTELVKVKELPLKHCDAAFFVKLIIGAGFELTDTDKLTSDEYPQAFPAFTLIFTVSLILPEVILMKSSVEEPVQLPGTVHV
jgi:hypothetical protein